MFGANRFNVSRAIIKHIHPQYKLFILEGKFLFLTTFVLAINEHQGH